MKTSESVAAIAAALAKAQGAMGGAAKGKTNPHFKSKYADLDSIVSAIKQPLADNGIGYVQFPVTNERDEVGVETMLMHSSGEWILSEPYFVPVSKKDAQGVGSAITYTRRYSLAAACGVAPEDDDGNAAAAAPAAPNGSARQVATDAFGALPQEQQVFLREQAMEIMGRFTAKDAALHEWIEAQHFDNEEKLALWGLLPSDCRSEIKRQGAKARQQLAEQA